MPHPFQDKLIVLVGTPQLCTRREVRDLLETVGGIPDDYVAAFVSYVVAFSGAEKTKMYKMALEREEQGFLTILDEEQFFDILYGRADPPEKPEHSENVTVIPAKDPETYEREYEQMKQRILNRKRMRNLAKHGVSTPEGQVKLDLRLLDVVSYYAKLKNDKATHDDE